MSKYFKCTTNKNPLSYSCGEKIIFNVVAKDNCIDTPCEYIYLVCSVDPVQILGNVPGDAFCATSWKSGMYESNVFCHYNACMSLSFL